MDIDEEGLWQTLEESALVRCINIRRGPRRKDEASIDGQRKDLNMKKTLDEYCKLKGWNEEGILRRKPS